MEIPESIAALQREGDLLASAASDADPDTPIPTCPDWRMRDLVEHVGVVHRWATKHVADRRAQPIDDMDELGILLPDDTTRISWFREGHARLVHTLGAAEPDLACWSFLPAPSPLAFWARRQMHETGIHRADAQGAAGGITPFPPHVAVDGIDEMLFGFAMRPGGRLRSDPARTLHLHATDIDGEWMVLVGPEGVEVRPGHGKGDCAVRATASDLHLLLWNRRSQEGLEVHGDPAVLGLWREGLQVRWSRGRGGGTQRRGADAADSVAHHPGEPAPGLLGYEATTGT